MHTITSGIRYVDLNFQQTARVIATGVLHGASGVALVDPGPTSCLETLRASLRDQGIGIEDITTVWLTHIHLDHAGATGTLVRENPKITVYVHERGATHLADPSRLLASATRLYGDDMDRLWGDFLPVPEANIRALSGGEQVSGADRVLDVAYLPGHASHHVGYFDRSSGVAFVGDTAGIRTSHELFVMPPTPPPDIDIEAWGTSVSTIRDWRPSTLFVTHFGPHEDPDRHLDALLVHLEATNEMARRSLRLEVESDEQRLSAFVDEMRIYLRRHLSSSEAALYDYAAPLSMCWLGLARYWRKKGG